MSMTEMVLALGLMSGTSLDGIDAALVCTDGRERVWTGVHLTLPYDDGFRDRLRAVLGRVGGAEVRAVEGELTRLHARAVAALLDQAGVAPRDVDLIGFHGHTIHHAPHQGVTRQIGDGALLADLTGIPVVNDFRSADVAAGGQGAPLVPLFHRALAARLPRPVALLNIGGVANVTWLGRDADAVLGFDTGPGNALIDDWVRAKAGLAYDDGGALAARGTVDMAVLDALMAHPYFAAAAPKSLDRDAFNPAPVAHLSPADGAATLTHFTAAAVAAGLAHLPAAPRTWLACGGGRHNATLMRALSDRLGVSVDSVDDLGWSGDALEAQAFGYLAVRSRLGLPLSLPGTTGVPAPQTGGQFHPPPRV
ncbi:anhydro-N-acetylmuramic acid kinase [Nitrospirillum sp. BR 11163]|uniref:anhydro-N-acetylmuramic acid kinase n=1 Tax=Nitrospirillum sp. BR 11163 TaxID=3104323 RepID=UPI002AFF7B04|nr:anhydro-N-acetylmuramic acid kinase [Nitrospirillum sp. BR 11163]MEA1674139.1 anhydro-N-acetylmuramic acid kinase [Nitrospirillum sp. BR 11163]